MIHTAVHASASWVGDRLGIQLTVTPAGQHGRDYLDAVELGLRVNPKRPQLLVSRILGKHIPASATVVLAAGYALGAQVRDACAGATPVVVGFAETATGLGHAVAAVAAADGGPAPCLHTTRRTVPAGATVVEFREEHSHATEQKLAVLDDSSLSTDAPLVLVDDELSTGRTALNAIRALHARWPRQRYILASLLDSRSASQGGAIREAGAVLGAEVTSAMLLAGKVTLPGDVLRRAAAVRAALPVPATTPTLPTNRATVHLCAVTLDIPTSAAYGWDRAAETRVRAAARALAATLPVHPDRRTLVLGDEEYMYFGQLLATALGEDVHTSTTTRSPAVAHDVPAYPLRTALLFPATEDPARAAFAYNVAPSQGPDGGNAPGFDDIVFVTDVRLAAHTSQLLTLLARCARRRVHAVSLTGQTPGGAWPRGASADDWTTIRRRIREDRC